MADAQDTGDAFVERFGFKVTGVEEIGKLLKELNFYKQNLGDLNKAHAYFDKSGKATHITLQGLTTDGKELTRVLEQTKEGWKSTATVVEKYVTVLTRAEQKLKNIKDEEQKFIDSRKGRTARSLKDTGQNDDEELKQRLVGKSDADAQAIIRGAAIVKKIRADELEQLNQKLRVEGLIAKAARDNFQVVANSERKALASRLASQAVLNKEAQSKFQQIRQSELIAAHTRKVTEEQNRLFYQFAATGKVGQKAGQEVLISWLSVQRLFVVQLLHQAVAQFRIALQEASQTAFEFSKRVGEIRTLSQDAAESSNTWSAALIKQSNAFGLDLLDVTKASYEALSNQIIQNSTQTLFLQEAQKLAIVTNSDLTVSVDALSSVLNSFKLSTIDSARVAAVLFRTIDLGKTTLPELTQNLGRVNSLSHLLGASFEEQQAALSTLTIQGLEDHTAKTLLVNIYQKLIRPTKHMAELFAEWGVTSGQAAVQTYGLGEVLQKLVSHAEESGDFAKELGEEFQELRASTGIATLDLDTFRHHLSENMQASSKYVKAFAIVNETEGRRIQLEITKLKNTFIQFGGSVNSTLLSFSERFGGAAQIVKTLAAVIVNLLESFVIMRYSVTALNVILFAFSRAAYVVTVALNVLKGSTYAATVAMGLLKGSLSTIVTLTIFAFTSLINYGLRWKERAEEAATAVGDAFKKLNEESLQKSIQSTIDWGKEFQVSSSSIFRRLSEINIAFTQYATGIHVNMKALNKAFIGNINDLFRGQVSSFKTRISELKKEINELTKDLERTEGDIRKTRAQTTDDETQLKLDLTQGDVTKQIAILRQAKEDTLNAANKSKGGPENFDKTLELYKQAYQFAQDLYKLQVQQNDPKQINAAGLDKLRILNAQTAEMIRQNGIRNAQLEKDKKELADQQNKLDTFQKSFGELKHFDTKKSTLEDFDKLAASLENAGKVAKLSVGEQIQLQQLIEQHRKDFQKDLDATGVEKVAAAARAQAAAAQKVIDSTKTALDKSVGSLLELMSTKFTDFSKNLENTRLLFEREIAVKNPPINASDDEQKTFLEDHAKTLKARQTFGELQDQLNDLNTAEAQKDFVSVGKIINSVILKVHDLTEQLSQLAEEGDKTGLSEGITDSLIKLKRGFNQVFDPLFDAKQLQTKLEKLKEAFKPIEDSLRELNDIEATTFNTWNQNQDEVNSNFEKTLEKINDVINALKKLRLEKQNREAAEETDVLDINGGQNKWGGGRIGYYAGGGRGTDTQKAYLSAGEYVWDRQTTKQMYPVIRGMHQNSKYSNVRNQSNNTNYNFGDFNINGNAANDGNLEQTIIRAIKRAARRGSLQLPT